MKMTRPRNGGSWVTCWCCGLCGAFVHPLEDPDALASLQDALPSQCAEALCDSSVEAPLPVDLHHPPEISNESEGSLGGCEKTGTSQLNSVRIHESGEQNALRQDIPTDSQKTKQGMEEATRISQKLSELEDDLKDLSLIAVVNEEDICPTCLDGYDSQNPKINTACRHHFHLGCILEWAERSPTCPMCNEEMVFNESFQEAI